MSEAMQTLLFPLFFLSRSVKHSIRLNAFNMLAATFVLFSLLGQSFAFPNFLRDDVSVNDQDLLLSCPGAAGSPNIRRADKCTLINTVINPDERVWSVVSDPQLNCGGGTQPITVTVGGSKTSSVSYTASATFNLNIEGIDIGGGGFSTEESTQVTTSNSTTYIVSPGRQVVQTIGVMHHSEAGNVQVNYGKRVSDHYIWFTSTRVTKLVPTDDVVFDTHETACGTDPRDMNNHS
ncbi:hypothetical protein QCA50_020078 [Cerrena zonata]|uniref:Uncharacterized protein n=1 Tax=Cerrena zonata TaxID=2478898 RepID=A0AAW0FJY2_9APHY